jgi:hypothetical protein
LSASIPFLIGAAVLVLICGLVLRTESEIPPLPALAGIASGLAALALIAGGIRCRRNRRRRAGWHDGLVRLESVLELNNALTCAAAGQREWPPFRNGADHCLRWHWSGLIVRISAVAVPAAAGFLLAAQTTPAAGDTVPPPRVHGEIAAAITTLRDAKVFRESDLDDLSARLDAIRNQAPEEWYRHSSLEAADHLQAALENQLQSLAGDAERAAASLESLDAGGPGLSDAEREQMARDFASARDGLRSSRPGLNDKLAERLAKIDPSSLRSIDPREWRDSLEQLRSACAACAACEGGRGRAGRFRSGSEAGEELDRLLDDGDEDMGRGGSIGRGPGVAPLPLNRSRSELGTDNPEALTTDDLRRLHPGDTIGTADVEHRPDRTPTGPLTGGSVPTAGAGGEAVWRESLLPAEKEVLQKYFK